MSSFTTPQSPSKDVSKDASNDTSNDTPQDTPIYKSQNLLPELIRAIKFANQEWGCNKIHKHIVSNHLNDLHDEYKQDISTLSTSSESSDATTTTTTTTKIPAWNEHGCTLGEVKKLYKKMGMSNFRQGLTGDEVLPDLKDLHVGGGEGDGGDEEENYEVGTHEDVSGSTKKGSRKGGGTAAQDVIEVLTVGTGGVEDSNREYTAGSVEVTTAYESATMSNLPEGGVEVGWIDKDVPMDKSGNKPHQGVICGIPIPGNEQQGGQGDYKGGGGERGGGKKKNKGKKKVSNTNFKKKNEVGWEVFKVQVAEGLGLHPMLVYNEFRTLKTFIHPKVGGDVCEVYRRVWDKVVKKGEEGKLGGGGRKGYFWGIEDGGKIGLRFSDMVEGVEW
ncbi:hypothetical protein TrCOL_g1883 [Triparma columacea]|uniref:Uncharacterized protein n=1 Tax=Triparma columacea TaxID=722753 RepID=A0A9W7L2P9_9STRA|nr:hypothetical protein TrCOL_g1883 [Triparma columacea]